MPISHATSYHRYFTCTNDIWNLENKHPGLHPSLTTKTSGCVLDYSPTITCQKTPAIEKNNHYSKKILRVFVAITSVAHVSGQNPLASPCFPKQIPIFGHPTGGFQHLGAMISTALVYLWCRTCPGPKTVSPTFARFGGVQNVQGDTL